MAATRHRGGRVIRGFTLVEVMLALTLGSGLIFTAAQFFVHFQVLYLREATLARMQENGRYALDYLTTELQMAGFMGAMTQEGAVTSALAGDVCFEYLLQPGMGLVHQRGVGTSSGSVVPAHCLPAGVAMAASDLLLVRRTLASPHRRQGVSYVPLDAGHVYLSLPDAPASAQFERGGGVASHEDVWRYRPSLLYVRKYSTPGDGVPTLCRRGLSTSANTGGNTQCLVEGVEALRVEFGLDEDGDLAVDRTVAAPSPAQLSGAMTATVYLLLRSIEPVAGHVSSGVFELGETLVPAADDEYLRRVLFTTVSLNNAPGLAL